MARRRRRASAKRAPARRSPPPAAATKGERDARAPATADRSRDQRPDTSPTRRIGTVKANRPPKTSGRAALRAVHPATWSRRVLASAALFSFGTAIALMHLIGELSYHTLDPRQALFYGGAAICAGIAVGLWLPRQIIIRRLRGRTSFDAAGLTDESAQTDAGGAGTAASLVGGLFLTTGVILLLLLLGAEAAESARLFLTERFTFPLRLTRALIWAPPLVGLTLAGACGTTALVALHGLHRLAASSRARISQLWLVIVVAAASGALATRTLAADAGAIVIALLPVFGAGLVTTFRRWPSMNGARPSPPAVVTNLASQPLFAAVVSAVAIGYAVVLALAEKAPPPLPIENVMALGGLGVAMGLLLGRWAGRRYGKTRADLAALLFLLGLTWILPYHWFVAGDAARLLAVAGIGAACIVLAARRVALMCENMQYVLSVVGVCVALGLTLALVSAPLWIDLLPAARIGLLLSLGIVAVVGILLLLDPRMPRRLRRPGLITVGIWLLITPALARRPAAGEPVDESADARRAAWADASALGRGMLQTRSFRTKVVGDPTESAASGWQIDMSQEQSDVLIVARGPISAKSARRGLRIARRFLGRCLTTLRRGGRLVIEQPDGALAQAAFGALRQNAAGGPWDAYLLEISPLIGRPYAAVLFGRDVPAWIAGREKPPDAEVALFPVESFADLRSFLATRGGVDRE